MELRDARLAEAKAKYAALASLEEADYKQERKGAAAPAAGGRLWVEEPEWQSFRAEANLK